MVTFVTQRTVLCFVIIEYANKLCADHINNIIKNNDNNNNNNNNNNNRTFVNFVRRSGQRWKCHLRKTGDLVVYRVLLT